MDIDENKSKPPSFQTGKFFAWIHSQSTNPLIIIELCRSKDPVIRYIGIKSLAEISDWGDSQFSTIRQALDYHTQIILARFSKFVDSRLFTHPPALPDKIIENDPSVNLAKLLEGSPYPNTDDCLGGVLRNYSYFQGDSNFIYHDPNLYDMRIVQEGIDLALNIRLKQLSALCIHSSKSKKKCETFVKLAGLQVLEQLLKQLALENEESLTKAAKLSSANASKTTWHTYLERVRLKRIYDTITNYLPPGLVKPKQPNLNDGEPQTSFPVLHTNGTSLPAKNDGIIASDTPLIGDSSSKNNFESLDTLSNLDKVEGERSEISNYNPPTSSPSSSQVAVQSNLPNVQMLFRIADIVGNVCQYSTFGKDIVRSGWLSILVEWSRSESISLSVRALRALANLDNFRTGLIYPSGVYVCNPLYNQRLDLPLLSTIEESLVGETEINGTLQPLPAHHDTGVLGKRATNLLDRFLSITRFKRFFRTSDKAENSNFTIKSDFNQSADVYFVHGLMGDPFRTWRKADRPQSVIDTEKLKYARQPRSDVKQICWPKDWLPLDIPGLRVMLLSYDTYLSEWAPKFPIDQAKRSLENRGADLLNKITVTRRNHLLSSTIHNNTEEGHIESLNQYSNQPNQIRKPIIFVTHSMGGLLIKQMLITARNSANPEWRDILSDTLGVVFYSTPHRGSPIAELTSRAFPIFFPSQEVQQLRINDPTLIQLNEDFLDLVISNDIKCLSFGETRNINLNAYIKFMIVPPESSNLGYGQFHEIPTNHLYVCKPHSRKNAQYRILVDFIQEILNEFTEKRDEESLVPDTFSGRILTRLRTIPTFEPFKNTIISETQIKKFLRYNDRCNDVSLKNNYQQFFPLF